MILKMEILYYLIKEQESYGIFKDGFVYYKTDIERARNEIEKLINDIEGIRRYW
jgi:hypothetical protein